MMKDKENDNDWTSMIPLEKSVYLFTYGCWNCICNHNASVSKIFSNEKFFFFLFLVYYNKIIWRKIVTVFR